MTDTMTRTTDETLSVDEQAERAREKANIGIATPPEFYAFLKEKATEKNLSVSRFALETLADHLEYDLPDMPTRARYANKEERIKATNAKAKAFRQKINTLLEALEAKNMSLDDFISSLNV